MVAESMEEGMVVTGLQKALGDDRGVIWLQQQKAWGRVGL